LRAVCVDRDLVQWQQLQMIQLEAGHLAVQQPAFRRGVQFPVRRETGRGNSTPHPGQRVVAATRQSWHRDFGG
jgi:hypothetical protein